MCCCGGVSSISFFFFNDTATTEIYTLSLHDALPICLAPGRLPDALARRIAQLEAARHGHARVEVVEVVEDLLDRKSTRLNSSHGYISYAVFCLKKKNRSRA